MKEEDRAVLLGLELSHELLGQVLLGLALLQGTERAEVVNNVLRVSKQ